MSITILIIVIVLKDSLKDMETIETQKMHSQTLGFIEGNKARKVRNNLKTLTIMKRASLNLGRLLQQNIRS